jgi:Domain of unknown function (DUF6457)
VDEWIDALADGLGQPRIEPAEMGLLLKLSREVAHGVDRRFAPLSAFVLGGYVQRRVGQGAGREEALRDAADATRSLIPDQDADGDGSE